VSIFYGLLAVALFVPLIYGLYWRKMSTMAAIASIFAAVIAWLVTRFEIPGATIGPLPAAAVGILVALVVAMATSFLFPSRDKNARRAVEAADSD
jgi:solute:Na+ symporter, SSS family